MKTSEQALALKESQLVEYARVMRDVATTLEELGRFHPELEPQLRTLAWYLVRAQTSPGVIPPMEKK
jgi:hypothetical protein